MRHWKYCNDCTKGTVLLDIDREYMRQQESLATIKKREMERKLELTEKALNSILHDYNKLKDLYARLIDNFDMMVEEKVKRKIIRMYK